MIEIRDASGDDAATLLELARALSAEFGGGAAHARMTAGGLAHDIERGRAHGLVAEDGQTIVGFALYSFMHFSLSGEHLYLDDLYVAPAQRSSGLGRRLMATLAERAQRRDCAGMTWFVERDNHRARRFYERLGASPAATRLIMSTLELGRLAGAET